MKNKNNLFKENFYDHILTLYNISWANPIRFNNELTSKFLEIERMPEKYGLINLFNVDAIGKLKQGDYVVIKYYDSYDINNICQDDIYVIGIKNENVLKLGQIDKVEYFFDPSNIFYIINSDRKIVLKKNDFKIKGRVILLIHQELPEFIFYNLNKNDKSNKGSE